MSIKRTASTILGAAVGHDNRQRVIDSAMIYGLLTASGIILGGMLSDASRSLAPKRS